MTLSDAHKQKLAEGRKRRAENMRTQGAQRAVAFVQWSEAHAKAWQDWQLYCGRAQHDCTFCHSYRRVTAAIPELGRDEDFEYARDEGLI